MIDWSKLPTETAQNRLHFVSALSTLRRGDPIFSRGTVEWVENSAPESVLSFYRVLDGRKVLVVLNMKKAPVTFTLENVPAPAKFRLERGAEIKDGTWTLQSFGFAVE